MNHSTLNRLGLSVIGAAVVALMAWNLLVDPFDVFGWGALSQGPSANERYLKIERLKQTPNTYGGLILGSSRSGMTKPEWLEARTGLKFYNLSAFSSKPKDMRLLYEAYRNTSEPPKVAMVGVDLMAFLAEGDDVDLSRRHHPDVDGAGRVSYWLDYLLAPSLVPGIVKLRAQTDPNVVFDFSDGTYALTGYEREIDEDHSAYMRRTFGEWTETEYQSGIRESVTKDLQSLLAALRTDEVDVKLFIQPMHRQWRDRMGSILPRAKRRMSMFVDAKDLSDMGSDKDELWYEQRHYREEIARSVVGFLFPNYAEIASETGMQTASGVE